MSDQFAVVKYPRRGGEAQEVIVGFGSGREAQAYATTVSSFAQGFIRQEGQVWDGGQAKPFRVVTLDKAQAKEWAQKWAEMEQQRAESEAEQAEQRRALAEERAKAARQAAIEAKTKELKREWEEKQREEFEAEAQAIIDGVKS